MSAFMVATSNSYLYLHQKRNRLRIEVTHVGDLLRSIPCSATNRNSSESSYPSTGPSLTNMMYICEVDRNNSTRSSKQPAKAFLLGSIAAILLFCLGLTPYMYLIMFGKFHPKPGSWGDLSSMKGMVR